MTAPAPAEPSRRPNWLAPSLGVLALALAAGVAIAGARSTSRKLRTVLTA